MWLANERIPLVTVIPHRCARRFLWVGVTHLPLTSRPATCAVNAIRTFAGSFSVKKNAVPTGGFSFRALLSRQMRWVWRACVMTGGVLLVWGGGGATTV